MANSTEGRDVMGCCGQKRAALRARSVVPAPSAPPPPEPDPVPAADEVVVSYRGQATALLHRGASGRLYVFSHAHPVRAIARQDAAALAGQPDFELRTH